jgi:uridine kinase
VSDPVPTPPGDIHETTPRTSINVRVPDGRIFEAPLGTTVGEFIRAAGVVDQAAVAALVDGRLVELEVRLTRDATVRPITVADADGTRIYRRSLALLLVTAAAELFPDASLFIEHSAPTLGAYFCRVRGRPPFSAAELSAVEARMREIVALDGPIGRVSLSRDEAIGEFAARGDLDTVRLLTHRRTESITLYELRGRKYYFQGYMVPSTGRLDRFALQPHPPGFLLRYPHQASPTELTAVVPYPRLFATFAEAGEWLDRLGIRSAGVLNDAIVAGRLTEVSLVAEALHEARVAGIAAEILGRGRQVRVVLVAGPSSSGKTTFARRLAVQLLANGRRPVSLGLDDYFRDRSTTPRDANGDLDFEVLEALDLPLLNQHLLSLVAGRATTLPRYSFVTGAREDGPTVTLEPDDLLIVEGIHGLNPALVPALPETALYRVYVSAITQLNLDRHNRVSISDTRLVRRIVRDAATRGYSAEETIGRWESVQRGERHHIFPFTENSDAIFNSSLAHELSVLRPLAEPRLLEVRPESPAYRESRRLLSFLQWFRPVSAESVPGNSILREFIGGSVLDRIG